MLIKMFEMKKQSKKSTPGPTPRKIRTFLLESLGGAETYIILISLPGTVIKHSDKCNLRQERVVWLIVPGYSPSLWEIKMLGT